MFNITIWVKEGYTTLWSNKIVGGTPKIRHLFAQFSISNARNL